MATRADEAGAAAAQEAALEFDQSHKHHVGPRYVRGGKDALGRPEGEGTMVWAGETCGKMAGQRYDGCFVAGLFEGAGTLCSCDALPVRSHDYNAPLGAANVRPSGQEGICWGKVLVPNRLYV